MNIVEVYQAIKLLPLARGHILTIQKLLDQQSYQSAIENTDHAGSHYQLSAIVKSYFWACRLLKNCQCLPRSIALYQHLKASGYDVTHRFGVNKQNKDLAAHAWVEYQHKPLNESPELTKRFIVLK